MDEVHRRYHEVANIFPLMQGAEYDALKADIAEHGQSEPIWLHPDGSIIDGRNRHRACVELDIKPAFRTYKGDSPVAFSISQNVKRRMLTDDQLAVIALQVLPMLEKEARERQIAAGAAGAAGAEFGKEGGRGKKNPLVARVPQGGSGKPNKKPAPKSRDVAGAAVGVSGRKVSDMKAISEKAPDLFEKVKNGEVAGADALRTIRKREAEAQKQEVLAKYDQVDIFTGALNLNSIALASIYDLDLPQESIDMVFTDPPYHDEYVGLYDRLGEVAARALKPGGYCLAYVGKMFIPDIISSLSRNLEYVSIFAVFQSFSQSRIMKHNIFENWRPILVFKKPGPTAIKEWAQDVVRGTRDKSHHEWQQDSEAPLQYIAAYTKPGDVVLDPFVGGGTTPWACKQIGRYFVAFDVNEEAVKLSMERVINERACIS